MTKRTCSIAGCDSKYYGRGWCRKHWRRWYRHGDPLAGVRGPAATVEEAFWSSVEKTDDCWLWVAAKNEHGYGILSARNGKNHKAHRYSLYLQNGRFPEGVVDHICGSPSCVRPDHLREVTHKENLEHRVRLNSNNATGYRGVYKLNGRFFAKAVHHGKQYHGGFYDTAEEANEAAIALRNRLFTTNDLDRVS